MSQLSNQRRQVDVLLAQRDQLQESLQKTIVNAASTRAQAANYQAAGQVLLRIGKVYRKLSVSLIEELVTSSLRAVFERPYTCELTPEEKRGQVELTLTVKDGDLSLDPTEAMGGGIVDILALSLRVVLWSRLKGRTDPIMILDEPMRMVAPAHISNAAALIKKLSERLKIQFIVVTHREALAYTADRTFRVTKNKYSEVTQQ